MPGRRFWILAASLSLTVAAMAVDPVQAVAKLAESLDDASYREEDDGGGGFFGRLKHAFR